MIDFLVDKLHDVRFMTMLLAAIAASLTAYTLVMPLFANRATFDDAQTIIDEIRKFAFAGQADTSGSFPSPACTKQGPQPSIGQVSESTDYTHVYANP